MWNFQSDRDGGTDFNRWTDTYLLRGGGRLWLDRHLVNTSYIMWRCLRRSTTCGSGGRNAAGGCVCVCVCVCVSETTVSGGRETESIPQSLKAKRHPQTFRYTDTKRTGRERRGRHLCETFAALSRIQGVETEPWKGPRMWKDVKTGKRKEAGQLLRNPPPPLDKEMKNKSKSVDREKSRATWKLDGASSSWEWNWRPEVRILSRRCRNQLRTIWAEKINGETGTAGWKRKT